VTPKFIAVDFVSFYIEILLMLVMFIFWMLLKRPGLHHLRLSGTLGDGENGKRMWYSDLVDVKTVDLSRDEYVERDDDRADDKQRTNRMTQGWKGYLWRLYYWIA